MKTEDGQLVDECVCVVSIKINKQIQIISTSLKILLSQRQPKINMCLKSVTTLKAV